MNASGQPAGDREAEVAASRSVPRELEQLRDRPVSALTAYDAEHHTELVATLQKFLALDGGVDDRDRRGELSPYETDGRERLSLGLKAQQILEAETRRTGRSC